MTLVNRNDLKINGASQYLAIQLTKSLPVKGKKSRYNLYDTQQIIKIAQAKARNKQTRRKTKETIVKIISFLQVKTSENIQDNTKVISLGQHIAKKQEDTQTSEFLAKIEANIEEMKAIRDRFYEVAEEAKKRDPNVFSN